MNVKGERTMGCSIAGSLTRSRLQMQLKGKRKGGWAVESMESPSFDMGYLAAERKALVKLCAACTPPSHGNPSVFSFK